MDHDDVRDQQEQVVLGDADLVLRTRSGDRSAFGELWRRHYRAGVTVARNMTSSLDPDDLVQEAYTRIYQSIVAGGGPTGSFRAYLFTSIRNTAAAWGRARRETAYDELDGVEDPSAGEHASEAALDRGLTHRAFRSLPTRWQEVLWYSEIEQMKPAEIAPLLGMKATAVAQLTFRAREGLREAWIQAHLQSVADGSDCQWTIERLGAYARRNLGRRDHAKVDAHLAACVRCSIVASEAKEVSSRLALVLLPLALGAVGTAGYLATVQGGSAPIVALAAMPQAVVQGGSASALPVGVTGGAATGGVAAGSGAAASTGAAGAAAGAATGVGSGVAAAGASAGAAAVSTVAVGGTALAGIGAASGLAAASLVVVGGVVAAAVALPPVGTDPVPAPTSISDVAPATPPLVPDTGAVDTALQLPGTTGPGPADLPSSDLPAAPVTGGDAGGATAPVTVADSTADGTAAGSGTASSGDAAEGTGGQGDNGSGGQGNAGGQSKDDTSTNGDTGSTTPATSGNGNAGTGNNGNGNGNGNGNAGTGNNGNADTGTGTGNNGNTDNNGVGNGNTGNPGAGTPTNGTGNGNGGTTGNGGSTGKGTPTNGTGNGNGGNTGAGNGAANGSTDNNGRGNGKGNGAVSAPQSLGVTPATTEPSAAAAIVPDAAATANGNGNGNGNGKRNGQKRAETGANA
ncbi:sigma-70 family RNA polymerase sigma factor [Microbacterium sp. NPDC058389]|uniref:sigma-70 family RNA polymerase sigma factor n=1 Tax=Microbacterium sp. NPDC058389 TaxID=3346475 RepID=UPI00365AE3BC